MKGIAPCVLDLPDLAPMSLPSPRMVVQVEQGFRPGPRTDLEGHYPSRRLHHFRR
jgi:hypothetical protein